MKTPERDEGVVADVRAARREIARECGYDLHRLFLQLREREKVSTSKKVRSARKPARKS